MANNNPSSSRNTQEPYQNFPHIPPHIFYEFIGVTKPDWLIPPSHSFPFPVDLYQLFNQVITHGGIYRVINNQQLLEFISLNQRISPEYLHDVYFCVLYDLEQTIHYSIDPWPGIHATINQRRPMQELVRQGQNMNSAPQFRASGMPYYGPSPSVTHPSFYWNTNQVWGFARLGLQQSGAELIPIRPVARNASSAPLSTSSVPQTPFQQSSIWSFTINQNAPSSSDPVFSRANPSTRQIPFQREERKVEPPEAQATATQQRQANFRRAPGAERERRIRLAHQSSTEDTGAETETKAGGNKSEDPKV